MAQDRRKDARLKERQDEQRGKNHTNKRSVGWARQSPSWESAKGESIAGHSGPQWVL